MWPSAKSDITTCRLGTFSYTIGHHNHDNRPTLVPVWLFSFIDNNIWSLAYIPQYIELYMQQITANTGH